ncbi:MAG TPA: hypothetical protein VNN80_03015, partial [Polyangiaceae bacterium]|nr:hypothetical protein [Polyangiaceae bacterium]
MAPSLERARARRRVSLGARLALGALAFVAPGLLSGACVIPDRTFEPGGLDCDAPSIAADGGCVSNPRCDDYCNAIESKCVGTDAVYDGRAQCLAVCNALPPGADGDTTGNSVACRLALLENAETTICPQVGPIGNGRCGGNCDAYCGLRREACQRLQPALAEFNLPGYC